MATSGKWLLTREECHRRDYPEEAAELERLRKAIDEEEAYLKSLLNDNVIMRGDVEGAFHRIREGDEG